MPYTPSIRIVFLVPQNRLSPNRLNVFLVFFRDKVRLDKFKLGQRSRMSTYNRLRSREHFLQSDHGNTFCDGTAIIFFCHRCVYNTVLCWIIPIPEFIKRFTFLQANTYLQWRTCHYSRSEVFHGIKDKIILYCHSFYFACQYIIWKSMSPSLVHEALSRDTDAAGFIDVCLQITRVEDLTCFCFSLLALVGNTSQNSSSPRMCAAMYKENLDNQ